MSLITSIQNKKLYQEAAGNYTRFQSKYDTIYQLQQAKQSESIEEINKALEEVDKKIKDYNETNTYPEFATDKDIKDAKDAVIEHRDEIIKKGEKTSQSVVKQKATPEEEALNRVNAHIDGLDAALKDGAETFDKLTKELSGHVSTKDMADAAKNISAGYDSMLKDTVQFISADGSTKFVEAWARTQFGDKLYESSSAIKNGASDVLSGIDGLMGLGDTFGGSWRDPKSDALKIQKGIQQIQSSVTAISTVANNIFKAVTQKEAGSKILGGLNLKNNIGVNTIGNLSGAAAIGIGSIDAFKAGDIKGGLSGIGSTVKSAGGVFTDVRKWQIDKGKGNNGVVAGGAASVSSQMLSDNQPTLQGSAGENPEFLSLTRSGNEASAGGSSVGSVDDGYGADMINEVHVMLDGGSSSDISCCTINGVKYKCSGYTLSQELLQPMLLTFSIEKENKEETQQDVIFADATQVIGKTLEMNATTIKTSQEKGSPRNAFTFKGMIIDVSASRATASAQSATITAATWDSLLQNAPHCRSFEKMTLKDIVNKVLEPYGEIIAIVNPRYTDKIPYIVQYNQSDYSFVRMLAARFGEWMYNTGDTFIFGEMKDGDGSADLEYPGGSLMSYHLNQEISAFSFNHLLPDHYKYGSSNWILNKSGKNIADGNVNDWTDKAYQASQIRYAQEHITALSNGGFDNWESEEGAETILDYSLKIEANGMKASLMTVGGDSKLAMLKIGQSFMICDNVQNKSGENIDVQQKILKVIGIHHSFDYRQEYSNSFTAIPLACQYPSYSDSSLHAIAPVQRAKVVDNKDEKKMGRIRVQFPWQEQQDSSMKTPWLRLSVPYSGTDKGHLFVPEIGEEVIVGFEMDNAERPYIIGSLYNGGEGKPDEKWASINEENGTTNNIKAIRTRNGHTILINDRGEAGILEIYDNKNNTYQITLSADDKKITIYSAGDIEINADGSITMNAKENVLVNANKEVSIQASKVKVR